MTGLQEQLFALQDPAYKAFHSALMPTVDPDKVIGVRVPALRRLAANFQKTGDTASFLRALPHTYYEEDNIHALCINKMTDTAGTIAALDAFLPFVDNWATCDMLAPAAFKKDPAAALPAIRRWMASGQTYTVRFGIGMLLKYHLDEHFDPAHPEWVAGVKSDEYYVRMMIAWYFATALAKQPAAALPYLENRRLSSWCHNKTIRKAVKSYRIPDEMKVYLRSLRIRKERGEAK